MEQGSCCNPLEICFFGKHRQKWGDKLEKATKPLLKAIELASKYSCSRLYNCINVMYKYVAACIVRIFSIKSCNLYNILLVLSTSSHQAFFSIPQSTLAKVPFWCLWACFTNDPERCCPREPVGSLPCWRSQWGSTCHVPTDPLIDVSA